MLCWHVALLPHSNLNNLHGIASLLRALRQVRAMEMARLLAARAAGQVSLKDPLAVADLLRTMRAVDADSAVHALLARNPATLVDPSKPRSVAELLQILRMVGAGDAFATLAGRAADQVSLDDPLAAAALLGTLCGAGPGKAADTLAIRIANAGMFGLFLKATSEADSYLFGREPDGTAAQFWNWQQPTSQNH